MWSQDAYDAALRFAAEAHRGQSLPGSDGLPYLVHLALVAMEVTAALRVEEVADPDLAVQVALLHDVIEDAGVSRDALAERFGAGVADGVQALSKDPGLPEDAAMADSLRRIRQQPREVWMVKLADRITNLAPPPRKWSTERRRAYGEEAGEVLAALGEASPSLADRLRARRAAYRRWVG